MILGWWLAMLFILECLQLSWISNAAKKSFRISKFLTQCLVLEELYKGISYKLHGCSLMLCCLLILSCLDERVHRKFLLKIWSLLTTFSQKYDNTRLMICYSFCSGISKAITNIQHGKRVIKYFLISTLMSGNKKEEFYIGVSYELHGCSLILCCPLILSCLDERVHRKLLLKIWSLLTTFSWKYDSTRLMFLFFMVLEFPKLSQISNTAKGSLNIS